MKGPSSIKTLEFPQECLGGCGKYLRKWNKVCPKCQTKINSIRVARAETLHGTTDGRVIKNFDYY